MTRVITALAISLAVCAAPAQAQSTRAKAKADSIARSSTAKPAEKPVTAPAAQAPAKTPAQAPAKAPAQAGKPAAGKPVESPSPQSGDLMSVMGANMSLQREVFSYADGGRRDPAMSLMNTSDIRPLITELQLIGIVYDEEGMNHMAILRNTVDTKKTQYHVKLGQMLGRLKVTQITRREVVFTVDEFGFSRQERLALKADTTAKRTP